MSALERVSKQEQLARVEAYFATSARDWEDLYARPRRVNDLVLANRRKLAVELVSANVRPGACVLDAGCGAGLVALDLLEHGFVVHCVDVAAPMLDLTRRRLESAGVGRDRYVLTRGELDSPDLAPASFEAILALGFLEYQADETATLARLHELLAPGGVLLVSGPTRVRLANYLGLATAVREKLIALGLRRRAPDPYGIGLHRYGPRRFRELLERSGFEFVKTVGHGFVEFEGPLRRLSYSGARALHEKLSAASRFVPIDRWGNDMIAIGRKPAA